MDACIIAGFSLIVMLATISLIGAWLSNDSKGIKIACTITIIIAIAAFLCAYMRNPFCFNGDEGMIGTIATIVSIPVTVLLGWNIYTVVDFNRKVEKAEEKVREEVEVIKAENQKLKDDYLELENSLKYMQSDITFTSIFNYARKMDNGNFTQYAIDGYMDALYVAVKDGLEADRKEVAIKSLHKIFVEYKDTLKQECPILPEKRNLYYSILSIVEPKDEKIRYLENFLLENTIDRYEGFPSGHIRIMSDYTPDSPHTKS